jgi:hypothetical protein
VEVEKNNEKVNLVAYGVKAEGKVLYVTMINREYGSKGRAAEVELELGKSVEKVETITMSQKYGDIAQVDGVTVGGAKFGEDGAWNGAWRLLTGKIEGKRVKIEVLPATAMVVKLQCR